MDVPFIAPYGLARDADGNVFVGDRGAHKIKKIDPSGIITTFAGTGTMGSDGFGGPATDAQLTDPRGIALADDWGLFIAEQTRVTVVRPSGELELVLGGGSLGYEDTNVASELSLASVLDVAPSSEPDHSTPACAGDSANAKIVAYHSGPYASRVIGPQYSPGSGYAYDGVRSSVFGSARVRSGLMTSQLCPSSVDLCTYWDVRYSTSGSWGDVMMGYVHQNR